MRLIECTLAALLVGGCGDAKPEPGSDVIARENARPGTPDWDLVNPALNHEIEGYATAISVAAGEPIAVAVSTDEPIEYHYRVFRTGWYGGQQAREVLRGGPLPGQPQPPPTFDPVTGLVEAHWSPSFQLDTTGWLTGVYLVRLDRADGLQSWVTVIVRDDTRDADIAIVLPTATWQAYNAWGGESLYESAHGLPGGKARMVSYDRPIEASIEFGLGTYLGNEFGTPSWLESRGYDVEYLADVDVGGSVNRLGKHKMVFALGHDEYATLERMQRLMDARDHGTSLAFLTGNTFYWQIRYDANDRRIICYKDDFMNDPLYGVDPDHVTTRFRDVGHPENALLGVISDGDHVLSKVDWIVGDASHWIYAGTGLHSGDHIPGIIGLEWDGLSADAAQPAGVQVVAQRAVESPAGHSHHEAVVYRRGAALVFSAGSIGFAQAVGADAKCARMLANVLDQAHVAAP